MGKNFKKVLSYALGIILAMGIGLTYAYAVGANDSNAFVTKTEWQAKVNQLETAIDNVTRTINDSNMDFVMNSPRIKMSMIDGFENCAPMRNAYGSISDGAWHYSGPSALANIYPRWNDMFIADKWNGLQSIAHVGWSSGTMTYTYYCMKNRFALRTNVANTYIIVSAYNLAMKTFHYVIAGQYPAAADITAKSLTVELPRSTWKNINNAAAVPSAIGRTNQYIFCGATGFSTYLNYSNSSIDSYTNTSGYLTRTVDDTKMTYTFEFPANNYAMRVAGISGAYFEFLPNNMAGKKYASIGDSVQLPNSSLGVLTEVYSPQKGCMCLKSYLNGEIPILN